MPRFTINGMPYVTELTAFSGATIRAKIPFHDWHDVLVLEGPPGSHLDRIIQLREEVDVTNSPRFATFPNALGG